MKSKISSYLLITLIICYSTNNSVIEEKNIIFDKLVIFLTIITLKTINFLLPTYQAIFMFETKTTIFNPD